MTEKYEWYSNELSEAERERLYLLIEEASEVIKVCTKTLRFGYDDIDPATSCTNSVELAKELGDFMAVYQLMRRREDFNERIVTEQIPKKEKKLAKYTRFQGL